MDLLKTFQNTILEHQLIQKNDAILISFSGGPDSLVLFELLNQLKNKENLHLEVFHLNHMMREEAAKEATKVAFWAREKGITVHSCQENIPLLIKQKGGSVQETARRMRFKHLKAIAKKRGLNRIALGHQADDQVETVLFNLIRGTGSGGAAGIPYQGTEGIIHPLLDIWRQDIEKYCVEKGLKPFYDPSNQKPCYQRNRIRLELIPYLENYNPQVKEAIWRFAAVQQQENFFVNALIKPQIDKALLKRDSFWELDLKQVQDLAKPLRSRFLLLCFKKAFPTVSLSAKHLLALKDALFESLGSNSLDLPQVFVEKSYHKARFRLKHTITKKNFTFCYQLLLPGETYLEELNSSIIAHCDSEIKWSPHLDQAELDADLIELPLYVRTRKKSDRFYPLGGGGGKKLKDFLIDKKVLSWERSKVLVVTDRRGRIIWVVGHSIDHRFRLTKTSQKRLILKFNSKGGSKE